MLRMQAIDANTVASIDWQDGKFVDHVGKINWAQRGNFTSGNITKDATYGNVFQGNGSAYWSANTSSLLPASSDMTVEILFRYTDSNHSEVGPWGLRNADSLAWGDYTDAGVVLYDKSSKMRFHRPNLLICDTTLSINGWHHIVWSIEGRHHYRAFLDGKLLAEPDSTAYPNLGAFTFIANGTVGGNIPMPQNTFLAAVRISNKARYTSDFDAGGVLTLAEKKCLIKSTSPQDFSAVLSVNNFSILGNEPVNTKRRIVFQMNDTWYKLGNNNGAGTLVKIPTQNITADSVLNEGNTVAELNALKSVPPFVGRYVYPAVAMYAADGVTTMPSIRFGFNYTEPLMTGKPVGICIDHMGDPAAGFKQVTANGNLLTQEYLDSSAPHDNANAAIAYGIVLNQPGNTYGDWRRIDINGNDLKVTDFSNVWPYNEIKTVTVDGQQMVRIPKIYVNNTKLTKGAYAGKWQYSIANTKIDANWHVHPAFMNQGKESNAILIGAHLASKDSSGKAASINGAAPWVSVTRDTAHSLGTNRNVPNGNGDKTGWHCYSIYDHHLIARLMLIEFGTADIPTKLTGKDNGMGATYRGINDVYGAVYNNRNTGEWLDGIDHHGKNNATRIFKNDGSQIYIDTGIASCGVGYVKDTLHNIGAGYDFGDIFLASVVDGTKSNGIFGDKQFTNGAEMNCGFNNFEDPGPFYLDYTPPGGGPDETLGFRLAKYA